MPHSCPAISTPYWTLPGPIQTPGSWLLLTMAAVVALVWARRVVAPVASWRARIPVALAYGLAVIMLLAALFILTLVLPPYQDASEMELLYFQPGASQAATDCAIEFLRVAQFSRNVIVQMSLLCIAVALLSGGACVWLRARWRKAIARSARDAHQGL
jgi:hypothetical protein